MEEDFIKFIAQALVNKPDEVRTNVVEGEQSTIIELRVDSEDLGKVIGRQGRIAKAMRTLLSAISAKEGKHITLEILD